MKICNFELKISRVMIVSSESLSVREDQSKTSHSRKIQQEMRSKNDPKSNVCVRKVKFSSDNCDLHTKIMIFARNA